jgi:hypothetical protein
MPYLIQPTPVFAALNTSGVINTDVTHTLVGAPGLGLAYRVSFVCISYAPSNTGAVEIRNGTSGEFQIAMECGPTGPGDWRILPPPGFLLAANTALRVVSRSNVVTQAFRILVHYFIDNLS